MNFAEDDAGFWFLLLWTILVSTMGVITYLRRRQNAERWVKRMFGVWNETAQRNAEKQVTLVAVGFIGMGALGAAVFLFVALPARLGG